MSRDVARVGVLGGTFDPPHIGHLAAAVEVRHALDLDEVLLVVANEPWQKTGSQPVSDVVHRLAMVEAAAQGLPGVRASAVEIERGGPSYTIDTLRTLQARRPDAGFFVVVGSDAAAGLDTWHRADELARAATFVLLDRPGLVSPSPPDGWRFTHVPIPRLDVTSTELRDRARTGRPLDVLVAPAVIAYIEAHRLYGWRTP
jgi:nicotinate-nucleotide adenylyltransferase